MKDFKNENIGYFLFKPDGEKKFAEMKDAIEKKFPAVRYFAVIDWKDIVKKLYHKHYEEKGDRFSDMFEPFLASVNELYGNYGIIAIVQDNNISKEELVHRVYEMKHMLRNRFSRPDAIGIVSNTEKMPEVRQSRRIRNRVRFFDFKGKEKKTRYMFGPGEYRLHFLNFVHSPDDDVDINDEELMILLKNDCLRRSKVMSKEDIEIAAKLKTFQIVEKYADGREISVPEHDGFEI